MRAAPTTQAVASEPSTPRDTTQAAPTPAPPPSYLDQVLGRVRNKAAELWTTTLSDLHKTEDWEKYRAPSLALPPTYPAPVLTPVRTGVPASVSDIAYKANHDIFTDGELAIPTRNDTVVPMQDLLRRPNWPDIIRNDLSVGKAPATDPLRIFIPGLNTPLTDALARLPTYSEQTGTQLALIANGTTIDLQPIHLTLPGGKVIDLPSRNREWLQAGLQRIGADFSGWDDWVRAQPKDAQGRIAVPAGSSNWFTLRDVRNLIVALDEVSAPNKKIVDSTQRLLMAYIDRKEDGPPLEIWGYSEGTIVLGLAFENLEARYLSERMKGVSPYERTRRLRDLRNRFERRMNEVTVLCIGPAWGEFKTKVRRVDFFAAHQYDQVPRAAGTPRMSGVFRAAEDVALFSQRHDALIAFEEPYNTFDAHNFAATGASALKLFFELNKTNTIRGLYEAESNGTLKSPTLPQVLARMEQNRSTDWLWDTPKPKPQPTTQRTVK